MDSKEKGRAHWIDSPAARRSTCLQLPLQVYRQIESGGDPPGSHIHCSRSVQYNATPKNPFDSILRPLRRALNVCQCLIFLCDPSHSNPFPCACAGTAFPRSICKRVQPAKGVLLLLPCCPALACLQMSADLCECLRILFRLRCHAHIRPCLARLHRLRALFLTPSPLLCYRPVL